MQRKVRCRAKSLPANGDKESKMVRVTLYYLFILAALTVYGGQV